MPNYVSIRFTIDAYGDRLQEILDAVRRDGDVPGSFDFNKVVPMPESLDMVAGTSTSTAISARLCQIRNELRTSPENVEEYKKALIAAAVAKRTGYHFLDLDMDHSGVLSAASQLKMSEDELYALGAQYLDNLQKYGAATWYEWRIENWGTKWNLPEGKVQDDYDEQFMSFETAWSAPLPIVKALSQKFPDVDFTIEWADEDIGQNVGAQTYRAGEVIRGLVPEAFSKEAYELAFDIHDIEPGDWGLCFDDRKGTYVYADEIEEQEEAPRPALDAKISDAEKKTQSLTATEKDAPEKDLSR